MSHRKHPLVYLPLSIDTMKVQMIDGRVNLLISTQFTIANSHANQSNLRQIAVLNTFNE